MKKLPLLLLGLLLNVGLYAQEDPVVLTIEGEDIHASEFMYIYSKNNDNVSFDKDSLDNYMELFINYKLKVKEAREKQYDTIPRLKRELAQYRKQLSLPYLTDEEKTEELVKEAYDRTVNEVHARHILVKMNPNPSPADTMEAYSRAIQLRNRILNGESFQSVAMSKGGSDDPSVMKNGGDLGYFSGLQMVYPFENAAFNTPVGEVSMPVRTRFGYHLIKVEDRRPAKGMIETAHILILTNDKDSKEKREKAEEKINEIYQLLESGEKFEELAQKYSDDKSSSSKGGLLPIFGAGAKQRMVPAFENAAYALENDGDYSKPVKSMFGWHIIKRIQLIPLPPFEKMKRELEMRVERDMRAETTKASFIEKLKKEYNYVSNAPKLMHLLVAHSSDSLFLGNWEGFNTDALDGKILFEFKDNPFYVKDFEAFLIDNQTRMRSTDRGIYLKNQLDQMVNEKIYEYENDQLERKYPEFKNLINEYSAGILVFEIMQDEIWEKASKDTAGIRDYFESNREDFTYDKRYKGDLFICKDKKTAKSIIKMLKTEKLKADEIVKMINHDSQLNVELRSQTFNAEKTDAFVITKKNGKTKLKSFKEGVNKAYKRNGEYYVMHVEEIKPARQREFSEAKGLVTAAYQNQLEKEWIESLRSKYNIQVHSENLYNLKSE